MATPSRKSDILKVRLGEDTRRMVLYNTLISYDDLVLMLQRVYDGKLSSSDEVTLKYQDEDGDLITIADASDFAHAREYSPNGVVKMIVFIKGREVHCGVSSAQSHTIRRELAEVRDRVNSLVDMLDTSGHDHHEERRGGVHSDPAPPPPPRPPMSSEAAFMFDPLKSSSEAPPPAPPTNTASTFTNTISTGTIPVSTLSSSSSSAIPAIVATTQPGASRMFSEQTGSQFLDPGSQPPPSAAITSIQPPSIVSAPPSSSTLHPTTQTSQSGYPPAPTSQSGFPLAPTSQSGFSPAPTSQHPAPTSQTGFPPAQTSQSGYPSYHYPNQSTTPVASAPQYPPGSQTTYPQPQAAAYAQYGATNTYSPQPGGGYVQQPQQRFPQPYGNPYKTGYRN